jgi:hypothetical protein
MGISTGAAAGQNHVEFTNIRLDLPARHSISPSQFLAITEKFDSPHGPLDRRRNERRFDSLRQCSRKQGCSAQKQHCDKKTSDLHSLHRLSLLALPKDLRQCPCQPHQ